MNWAERIGIGLLIVVGVGIVALVLATAVLAWLKVAEVL